LHEAAWGDLYIRPLADDPLRASDQTERRATMARPSASVGGRNGEGFGKKLSSIV